MSKRKIIIIIIILVILGLLAFFFLYKNKQGPTNGDDPNGWPIPWGKGPIPNPDDETPYIIPNPNNGNVNNLDIKLKKVSTMPVAGFGIFVKERYKEEIPEIIPEPVSNTTDVAVNISTPVKTVTKLPEIESVPAVRYMARSNGNIYQTFADKILEKRFSSTIIPKIYDAYFNNTAESVALRYLKDDGVTIITFSGSLPKESLTSTPSENNELKGTFLPENIKDISLSADLSKIFYLFNLNDASFGVTAGVAGDSKTEVFNSPFTEWLSSWPNASMITLTTKPTSGLPGYVYVINPAKKDFSKILGGINGLTTLASPDGKNLLYSNNNLELSIFEMATKNINKLGVTTSTDKCVWSKSSMVVYCAVPKSISNIGSYPDIWYKGQTSFSDQIWKINTVDRTTEIVVDPISVPGGEDIDGIKLALDKDENYLFFVNKKDSFLWELELN